MQTSFMHPPFGFALFYLRSVAPAKEFTDRLTGRRTAPVTTGQIYWGAVPFVLIQILMVGLIIAFPNIVSGGLGTKEKINIENIRIETPSDQSGPGGKDSSGSSDQDEATKALEREMGGGAAKAPDAGQAPAGGGSEQDDAAKALEKAMGGGGDAKSPAAPPAPEPKK